MNLCNFILLTWITIQQWQFLFHQFSCKKFNQVAVIKFTMFNYSVTSSVSCTFISTSLSRFHSSRIEVLLRFEVTFHFSYSHGAIQITIHDFKMNFAIHNLNLDLKT